jgi:hypothetical protein
VSCRRLFPPLLAVLIAVTACHDSMAPSAPPGAARGSAEPAAARVVDKVSVTRTFHVVLTSTCLQEVLTLDGTFHEQFTSLAMPGDPVPYHYQLTDVVRGTGTSSSGAQYKYLDTEHQTLSQPNLESLHFTFSFPTQQLFIGKGAAPNLIVHFSTHTTVLPSGELQVSIDEVRVTCQNR